MAARGIDIPAVGVVLNHNVPALPRDFIHRCGRTARAGRAGRAITFVSQYDVEVLLAIETHIGRKMDVLEPTESEVLDKLQQVATARRAAVIELTENGFLEREKARREERKAERLGGGESAEDAEAEEAAEEEEDAEDEDEEALEPVALPSTSSDRPTAQKKNKNKKRDVDASVDEGGGDNGGAGGKKQRPERRAEVEPKKSKGKGKRTK